MKSFSFPFLSSERSLLRKRCIAKVLDCPNSGGLGTRGSWTMYRPTGSMEWVSRKWLTVASSVEIPTVEVSPDQCRLKSQS